MIYTVEIGYTKEEKKKELLEAVITLRKFCKLYL